MFFRSALFAVIIPLSKEGDLEVIAKGRKGEEVMMDWRKGSMIVVKQM